MAALVLGCGGDVGGLADNGGISGTGISSGPITGFGSIFVNDVRWEIGAATITIDGVPASEADLRVGMVVRVLGSFDQMGTAGTATAVVVDDAVEGPIDAAPVTVSAGVVEFTVFGIAIRAQQGITQFEDGATLAGLMAGDVVEVSGLVDETGVVVATRIAQRSAGSTDVELRGVVSNLMRGASEFMLGSVTVVYGPTLNPPTVFEGGLSSGQDLADGQLVEVEGRWLAAQNRIEARVVELEESGLGIEDADELKLRGFVSGFMGIGDFMVSGVPVDASAATFDPSSLSASLANGDYVEVEGRLVAGQLVADEVELEDIGDEDNDLVRIRASVPAGGVAGFGPNTLSMLASPPNGLEVQVPSTTQFDDDRSSVPNFGLSDIVAGDRLEIRAFPGAANSVITTRIKRVSSETDVSFQGPVTFVDASSSSLSILGRPIALAPGVEFEDVDESPLGQSAFFSMIQIDTVVKVKDENAVSASAVGPADEVSIEAQP